MLSNPALYPFIWLNLHSVYNKLVRFVLFKVCAHIAKFARVSLRELKYI